MKNLKDKVDNGMGEVGRVFKFTFFGVVTGLVAGAIGGVIAGEELNNYSEFLSNSPKIIQYSIDATGAILGSGIGFFAGGAISHFLGGYGNIFRDI